jgi:hypothetical protein
MLLLMTCLPLDVLPPRVTAQAADTAAAIQPAAAPAAPAAAAAAAAAPPPMGEPSAQELHLQIHEHLQHLQHLQHRLSVTLETGNVGRWLELVPPPPLLATASVPPEQLPALLSRQLVQVSRCSGLMPCSRGAPPAGQCSLRLRPPAPAPLPQTNAQVEAVLQRLARAESAQQEVDYLRSCLEQLAAHQQVGAGRRRAQTCGLGNDPDPDLSAGSIWRASPCPRLAPLPCPAARRVVQLRLQARKQRQRPIRQPDAAAVEGH